ncbi:Lipase/lipooxygenase, PLAT/LH2 [Cynara cardunculus var. scolymus]|uniref:Lipoxygenase n=1 Tax=Cynara cardunculus var. scolymus TaxID=59895 RepID=A0A103M5U0_CYNCS|nr:Lipase/lipooxygenase, PLAT/LH2 [Cynara cardunculus var. scolymus]
MMTIKGRVVLMKKNVLDINDLSASVLDRVDELLGKSVVIQLIGPHGSHLHSSEGSLRGKVGKPAILEDWITTITPLTVGESSYKVSFEWDEGMEVPGAFLVKNHHHSEFYLKTLTLEDVPGHGQLHFVCNSWVYPTKRYKKDRIFFANKSYLPSETPTYLRSYRDEELEILRGDGTGMLQEWDRVYDYAFYNDLGDPDKDVADVRPVLGGSSEYPYPRRCRTGRPTTKSDPKTESRLPLLMGLDIYVPRDERFGHLKLSDFLAYGLKSIVQFLVPEFEALCDSTRDEFDSFEDVMKLYEGGFKLPEGPLLDHIRQNIPLEMLKILLETDSDEDKSAWRTDEEFAREMSFPLRASSTFKSMALKANRLFILDHHDSLMPYLKRINATTNKIYATRTLLLLQNDGTLKPIVIELSLPHPEQDNLGAISEVYTPAENGVEGSVWHLAKAYVAVSDSGIHQLISHWQLSVLHPIHKLLYPHFRDTMNINAFARQILIYGGGILEKTVFPGKYSMELSSVLYKDWDYPYAVDGLEIWSAIKSWVEDYCKFYYKTDHMVKNDKELQSWWKELREEGHGDKKEEPWWPKMQSCQELIQICTTFIWVASALHASVNYGQYPYAGYLPNRPTLSRRFMPKPNTPEYDELKENPDKVFLKTITPQLQMLLGIALIEILSRHSSDEVYLGQRECPEWTMDAEPLKAFEKFGKKLKETEERIVQMNNDERLKNRVGPVKMPYTLLYPTSKEGITGRGIPNSTSM